jgi:hypothetical protein
LTLREWEDLAMDGLPIGSVQSWLAVAATTAGPLIALIIGFEGADWFLRRLREIGDHAPVQGARGRAIGKRAWPPAPIEIPSSLDSFGNGSFLPGDARDPALGTDPDQTVFRV